MKFFKCLMNFGGINILIAFILVGSMLIPYYGQRTPRIYRRDTKRFILNLYFMHFLNTLIGSLMYLARCLSFDQDVIHIILETILNHIMKNAVMA